MHLCVELLDTYPHGDGVTCCGEGREGEGHGGKGKCGITVWMHVEVEVWR